MDVVQSFYRSMEAREWAGVAALLAEDVVYEMPQTRERVTGRDAYLRFNQEYPADWHLEVHRVVAGPDGEVAVWVHALDHGRPVHNLAFLTLDGQGLIARIADFWPDPYEPPAGRPPGVERY
jgi:ketosteroid isomerase-like protein